VACTRDGYKVEYREVVRAFSDWCVCSVAPSFKHFKDKEDGCGPASGQSTTKGRTTRCYKQTNTLDNKLD